MAATLFHFSVGAAVYKVGDYIGWNSTSNSSVNYYKKWASTKTFRVGDVIVFEYDNKFHNVKQVSHQDFQSCNATSPMAAYTSGFDGITLIRTGHYYFLCGVAGHCQAGHKVEILVIPASLRSTTAPTPPDCYINSDMNCLKITLFMMLVVFVLVHISY